MPTPEHLPHDLAERSLETPDLVLRAPRADDLETLVAIDASWGGAARREYLRDRLRRALRPTGISLGRLAECEGNVVGFVLGEVTRGEFGRVAPVAWVDTIGVRKDALRRKVGSTLLSDFERHGRAAGADRLATLVEPNDEALTDFLEAHGFRLAPTRVVERPLGTL
jgi:GNAT superfamily N-acetyltransferase